MGAGKVAIGIGVLAAAAFAWQYDVLQRKLQPWLAGTAVAPPPPGGTGGVRKCAGADGAVVYTQEACPSGSREQPMGGGSLSVLPAPKPAAMPASARPLLRQWAPDADGPTIKERIADRTP